MKKTIFIIVAWVVFSLPNSAQAQYSDLYYHRVGDTIEWRAPNGYYSWWEWENFYNNIIAMNEVVDGSHGSEWSMYDVLDSAIILQRFYTPVPLKIIGIAGSGSRVINITVDTNASNEYYLIYDAGVTDMILLKQVPWKTTDPHRILHVKMHKVDGGFQAETPDSCCWNHPRDVYFPIYEYYFDTAIYVTDSFYVGGTLWDLPDEYRPAVTVYNSGRMLNLRGICSGGNELLTTIQGGVCAPTNVTIKRKSRMDAGFITNFSNAPWRWKHPTEVSLIYPIIEVDTTVPPEGSCIKVGNVEVFPSGTSATVTWDNFPNYTSVIISYGPCNVPQSLWDSVNVTGMTFYALTGLNPSSCYNVRMKAVCDKQEMPWSTPVRFYSGTDTSGNESVSGPTILSAQTFIQPNPASNEVSISSSFNLSRIEIHDASGILVYSEQAVGHQKTINIGFLHNGTYFVTIQTYFGTTHKKLIVQM